MAGEDGEASASARRARARQVALESYALDGVEKLKTAFSFFDADGSGKLSADEVLKILTMSSSGAPLSLEDAQEFIDDFDANADGLMDIDEFCKAMVALTDPSGAVMDDGVVDDAEMRAGAAKAGAAALHMAELAASEKAGRPVELVAAGNYVASRLTRTGSQKG